MKHRKPKRRSEFKTTNNQTVYNRLLRMEFSCSYCPPNRGENSTWKRDRSWKKFRKTQYKVKK